MTMPMTKRQHLEKTMVRYMERVPEVTLTINDEADCIEYWDTHTKIQFNSVPVSAFYRFMERMPCDCEDCNGLREM